MSNNKLRQGTLPAARRPDEPVQRRFCPDPNGMTEMQQRFAAEYMIDLDGPKAAIRAGYTPGQAHAAAMNWLKHPPVRDHIARLQAERSRRTGISADRILHTLGQMFFGDPVDLMNEHGGLRLPGAMAPADRMMIAGWKTRQAMGINADGEKQLEEVTEIKLVEKTTIASLLMRHLGMMNDKVTVEHTSLADRLRAAQLRQAGPEGKIIDAELVEDEEPLTIEYEGLDPDTQAALDEVLGFD
jgi:phage terminase small subunit